MLCSDGWDYIFNDPLLSMDLVKDRGLKGLIASETLRSLYWKVKEAACPSEELQALGINNEPLDLP
jgi:hypothetical protein